MGSTDAASSMIRQVRQALLVTGAAGTYLDAVGNNRGVPRPDNTSDDELYRRVIKALAGLPKGLSLSYYALLSSVLGSQEQVRLRLGRPWRVYEVNANEVVVELPVGLTSGTLETSTYLHGASGFARVPSGPSNTFTTDFDLSLSSAVSVVGLAIHVETTPGTWTSYTVSSYSFNAGTSTATVQVSASTLPTGGGSFFLEVPGDGAASYRGDYLAAGATQSLYSTAAGPPVTNALLVVGDVTGDVLPGSLVQVSIGGAFQPRVVSSLSYSAAANYPPSAAALAAAAGGGTWSAGWLCEDPAASLLAAFGGVDLPEVSGGGSPAYRVPGPFGDFAVRVSVPNTGFLAASSAFLDADATKDVCGVVVMRAAAFAGVTFVLSKATFSGPPTYSIQLTSTNIQFVLQGTVTASATVPDTILANNEWFAVMFALERGTNTARIGIQSLASGTTSVGSSVSTTTVGTLSNAAGFRLCGAGSLDTTVEVAAAYMGVAVAAASGLPANLGTRLSSFCASLGAPNVTRVTLTTTDVPGGQTNQPFLVAQELADTATTPPHSDRVYLTGTGLYQIVQFYLDLLVRAAGVVVRLVIV